MGDVERIEAGVPGPGQVRVVEVEGEPVAVWNVDGHLYALADTCTHEEASLADGQIDGEDMTVECPLHTSRFSLRTGDVLGLPAVRGEQRFEVRVSDGDLIVERPTAGVR